jgi:hypothetical protein
MLSSRPIWLAPRDSTRLSRQALAHPRAGQKAKNFAKQRAEAIFERTETTPRRPFAARGL